MAKDPGQKRSLDEIKQRIERSRYELGRDLGGLRYELDIPLKIKKSFQRKTALWITAAVVLGLMFTVGPVRKKKIYVDAKGKRKGTKKTGRDGFVPDSGKVCGWPSEARPRQLRNAEIQTIFQRRPLAGKMVRRF